MKYILAIRLRLVFPTTSSTVLVEVPTLMLKPSSPSETDGISMSWSLVRMNDTLREVAGLVSEKADISAFALFTSHMFCLFL